MILAEIYQGRRIKSAFFLTKEVGTADTWSGELDGSKFHIHSMKEPDYVMSLMSSYGAL